MQDWFTKKSIKHGLINWLALDSLIDSGLYNVWERVKNAGRAYSNFCARFRAVGFKAVIVEFLSEGLTLGTGGFVVLLTLALPAFEETREDWRETGQFSVTFQDRFGNEIGKRGILHDDAVPLDEIPSIMIKAVLATEDRRFFDHFGIDIVGTFRAMVENVRANDVVQGGSSLTQQLAKNVFLTSERTLERKIKEAFLAMWLESRLTKKEILKLYLDRAYMGGGTFGVEAASQFYFDKTVREISLSEAAMLAGLFKAPTKFAPHLDLPASRARANEVLSNMVEAGFMTEGQVHGARLNPAQVVEAPNFYVPNYYLDWAFEEVQRIARGKGDFVVTARTTIDINLQKAAEASMNNVIRTHALTYRASQGALVTMEPNGAVRAMYGGKDYGDSQFNRATKALRQPGSSFKPYVYLTAMQHGFRPTSVMSDGFVSCGRWSPKNYSGGFRGRLTLSDALKRSVNTIAVKLSLRVGRKTVVENVKKMGLNVRPSCSMALGDTGITPLQHTGAYAVFANGGKQVRPYAILEIKNSRDEVIYDRLRDEPKPVQIFDRAHVENVNQMLERVVTEGTGRRAQLEFTAAAGKTGTSSSYRDAWFMGYTGQFVTGVWFGNDNYRPMNRATGGSIPAMAWKQFMTFAHTSANIPRIPGLELHPNQVAELNRGVDLKRKDPTLGTVARSRRSMSKKTIKALADISRQMKAAKKESQASAGDKNDDRAGIGSFQTRTRSTSTNRN